MPMSAFGRSRWFGDDEENGPTPLFPATTEKQSLFPVKSDESPVLSGLKAGWKGLGDWLNGPAGSDAGTEGDLLGYKPTNRWGAISDALAGAAKGVLGARGEHSNWFGQGLLGASEGMKGTREHDLELRKLAQQEQYKNAEMALKRVQAAHAGEYTIGRTRFDETGKPLVTAPPEEMSEYQKGELDVRRGELEHKGDITPYQQQELALRKAEQAHKGDLTPYQRQELELRKADLAQKQAAAADAAKLDKSGPERDRTKLVTLSSKLAAGQELTPEERPEYERLYREAGQEKSIPDPVTGMVTTVRPDIGDLARPPSMAAAPAPGPGVSQAPAGFPRAQLEDVGKKYTSYKGLDETVTGIEGLLKDITPGELLNSDKAARLNVQMGTLVNALAAAGGTGVVQEGEARRYASQLGDLTGMMAAGRNATGLDHTKAILGEVRDLVRRSVKSAAPTVGSPEEAKNLPRGTPFMTPNGHLAVVGPDGNPRLLDGGG